MSIKDISEIPETGVSFRDVGYWIRDLEVNREKILRNLKSHLEKGLLSPREQWFFARLRSIVSLNDVDEISVSSRPISWFFFWASGVQVMVNSSSCPWRIQSRTEYHNESRINARNLMVIRDSTPLIKRQVTGVLLLKQALFLRPQVESILQATQKEVDLYIQGEKPPVVDLSFGWMIRIN